MRYFKTCLPKQKTRVHLFVPSSGARGHAGGHSDAVSNSDAADCPNDTNFAGTSDVASQAHPRPQNGLQQVVGDMQDAVLRGDGQAFMARAFEATLDSEPE